MVFVVLRAIFVIPAGSGVILHGFGRYIYIPFSFGIIITQCGMEFKFGKEMHFIVYIEVADKTLYFAGLEPFNLLVELFCSILPNGFRTAALTGAPVLSSASL